MVSSSERQIVSTYVIDSESPAELVRLLNQDRFFTRSLGLVPAIPEFSRFRTVLDIGCGPGGWALEMAKTYPSLQITAIDTSNRVIDFARAQAESQQIHNVNFLQSSVFNINDFPDNGFDFVNGRFMVGFMPYDYWPKIAMECKRVLRPGGVLCLTDTELPLISAPICQQFFGAMNEALYRKGYGRSHSANQVTLSLRPALLQAGYKAIERRMHQLDFSFYTEEYQPNCQNIIALVSLMKPCIIEMKVLSEEEYEDMRGKILADLYSEGFLGEWLVLSAWGYKPQE